MIKKLLQNATVLEAMTPQANTGAAITGAIVDRLNYDDAIIAFHYAAASGAPDAATTALVLQHGDASNLSDAATFLTLAAALDIDAAAGIAYYAVDLVGAKRYIRLTADATYTGGTTPGNVVGAVAVLGNKKSGPAVADAIVG